jgi:hypothetical protein
MGEEGGRPWTLTNSHQAADLLMHHHAGSGRLQDIGGDLNENRQ